jgi:hypothetical protein
LSAERLGWHRWMVERTLAWLMRYRRPLVRYERRANIHEEAVCAFRRVLICLNYLAREFCSVFLELAPIGTQRIYLQGGHGMPDHPGSV